MTSPETPLCYLCSYYDMDSLQNCIAFPKGIPDRIFLGRTIYVQGDTCAKGLIFDDNPEFKKEIEFRNNEGRDR